MASRNDDDGPSRVADDALWRRVTGSVRPLPRGRGRGGPPASGPADTSAKPTDQPANQPIDQPADQQPAAARPPRRPPLDLRPSPPLADAPRDLSHGAATGLDKRSLARLRRGMLPIEGTIDLHGMTQAEAHGALHQFIAGAQQRGRRCVLVITGKGSHSEGVLRAAVPHWLNLPPTRGLVLAFAYATPAHGGAGALYVLLKRRRVPPG
jgi:DNA-nicking Smr family endonuclease